eukprot:TRINITY_DN2163_c0_g1_i1.p1 TRINITY_DN2163_c0_g1~~TRINITY_DN2163_c0_g1_i1.p1  ORF type:complete len:399 (-),score=89.24 TRINITY_DN2163_c0_g1_i1:37-1233(-)
MDSNVENMISGDDAEPITKKRRMSDLPSEENSANIANTDTSNELIAALRKSNDDKDIIIKDIQTKLKESQAIIDMQNNTIKDLQKKLADVEKRSSLTNSGHGEPEGSPMSELAIMASVVADSLPKAPSPFEGHPIELRILRQPPTQAIYQRILRPFPTVGIVFLNPDNQLPAALKKTLFVEASIMKQRGNEAPVEDEDAKKLIGGQLVGRCEVIPGCEVLSVVFRKLKILTTTMQQRGSFFVLKFVLKNYEGNTLQVIPHVKAVISDPVEVFSHTLYLKGRPGNSNSTEQAEERAAEADQKLALEALSSIKTSVPLSPTGLPSLVTSGTLPLPIPTTPLGVNLPGQASAPLSPAQLQIQQQIQLAQAQVHAQAQQAKNCKIERKSNRLSVSNLRSTTT